MDRIAFAAQPTATVAGAPLAVTVDLVDFSGQVDADDSTGTVALSIYTGPAGGALGGTVVATAVNGVASFAGLDLVTAGTYQIFAHMSAFDVEPTSTDPFLVGTGPPAALAFRNLVTQTTAGSGLANPLTDQYSEVAIVDAYGNVCDDPSDPVLTFTASDEPSAPVTSPAFAGIAPPINLVLTKAGQQTITATGDGLTASAVVTVAPGLVTSFAVAGLPAQVTAGQPFPGVTVTAVDQFGNLSDTVDVHGDTFNGQPILLNVYEVGQSALVLTTTVDADGGGVTPALQGAVLTASGTYGITAEDGRPSESLTSPIVARADSGTFAVVAGPAAALAASGLPSGLPNAPTAEAGRTFGPVVVSVEDAYGNRVTTDDGSPVVATLADGTPLDGPTTAATVGGEATFAGLSIGAVGTYGLTFADGSLAPSVTPLTVRPALLPAAAAAIAGRPIGALRVDLAAYFSSLLSNRRDSRLTVVVFPANGLDVRPAKLVAAVVGRYARVIIPAFRVADEYDLVVSDARGDLARTQFTVDPATPVRVSFVYDGVSVEPDGTVRAQTFDRFGNISTGPAGATATLAYAGPAVDGKRPTLGGTVAVTLDASGGAIWEGLTLPPLSRARLMVTVFGLPRAFSIPFATD